MTEISRCFQHTFISFTITSDYLKYILNKILLIALLVLSNNHLKAQTVVSTNSELQTAISSATAGSEIILTNGVWTDVKININKIGTDSNPIVIKAQTFGQVFMQGNTNISLGGKNIYLEGFVFKNPSNLITSSDRIEPIIEFRDTSNNVCNNCRVTNIKIDSYASKDG